MPMFKQRIGSAAAATHVGMVRQNNEDNYYLCGAYKKELEQASRSDASGTYDNCGLYAVCDGMGGEQYGEVASLIAVQTLDDYQKDFDARVDQYIRRANYLVCDEIRKRGCKRIGTTFAVLSIEDGIARAYNIGDSRIYWLRNGNLTRLSQDHTEAQRLINMGLLTEETAGYHPGKHRLTQHLGIFPSEMVIEPFVSDSLVICPRDIFLLCSDGLTDMLTEEKIRELLLSSGTVDLRVDALIDAALKRGGKDNVTVLLVEV